MRLLLDEMYAPAEAEALRHRGHDVIAIKEHAELRGLPDDAVLGGARTQRAVVTENIVDFSRLHALLGAGGQEHAGLVFVHQRRYPRTRAGRKRLVDALDQLLSDPPVGLSGPFGWWLA